MLDDDDDDANNKGDFDERRGEAHRQTSGVEVDEGGYRGRNRGFAERSALYTR